VSGVLQSENEVYIQG